MNTIKRNIIGDTFVTHDPTRPVHVIKAWSGPGHPDELPLCGANRYAERSDDDGGFDVAGNPMPRCHECLELAQAIHPVPSDAQLAKVIK